MATLGIGINEMRDALQKAGLPMSGRNAMEAVDPYSAREAVGNVFMGQSKGNDLRQQYKEKIAKIAQLDQRLSQIYSDPNSQYFIENPSTRESLTANTENIGLGGASGLLNQAQAADQQAAGNVSDALTYYNYLTGLQPKPISSGGTFYNEDEILRDLFGGETETSDYTEVDKVLSEIGLS